MRVLMPVIGLSSIVMASGWIRNSSSGTAASLVQPYSATRRILTLNTGCCTGPCGVSIVSTSCDCSSTSTLSSLTSCTNDASSRPVCDET
ncbi:hypothetical protein D9M70_652610 [compost metagenome]